MKQNTKNLLVVACVIVTVSAIAAVRQYRLSSKVNQMGADVEIGQNTRPMLLELGSHTCIPCKEMMPVLAELTDEFKGVLDVKFIDVKVNPDEVNKYGIRVIPTQIFFDAEGKELFRHEGFYGKDSILAKFQEHGINLKKTDAIE